MTVSLDVQPGADVAVLRGIDTDAALAHLCRSLVTGSVFDAYRALVIDLDGCEQISPSTAAVLGQARATRRAHRQWLETARAEAEVRLAVERARQWLRLVDGDRAVAAGLRLVKLQLGLLAGLAEGVASLAAAAVRRTRDQRPA